jgi:hypothetical protein
MPAPAWENLDEFLDLEDFAFAASVQLRDGSTRQVAGIFDDPYMNAQLGEYDLDTSKPRFTAKETDLAGVDRGDVVTLAGKQYDVLTGPQSTGDGLAVLQLAEV